MKLITTTLLSCFLLLQLQAQTNEAVFNEWFWNISAGSTINTTPDLHENETFRSYYNLAAQLSIGQRKELKDKWTLIQAYRLRATTASTYYTQESRRVNPQTEQVEGYLYIGIANTNWQLQTEVPIYLQYQMSERLGLTGGLYGALTLVDHEWNEASQSGTILVSFGFPGTTWLPQADVGTEFGLVYKASEHLDLRLNVQQSIVQLERKVSFLNDQTALSASPFQPLIMIGANVGF